LRAPYCRLALHFYRRRETYATPQEVKAERATNGSSLPPCSELLLGSDVGVVAALSLSAVGSLGGKGSVALSANHLLALVRSGKSGKGGLDGNGASAATSESEDEVKGGLLLDVVVGEGASVLELLASEDESLLIGRDAFLVLDLSLHVLNSVAGLHIESDRLTRQSLNENLHIYILFNNKMKSTFSFSN
jgi:hypothetical protein